MTIIKKLFPLAVLTEALLNCHSEIGISVALGFNEPHLGQGSLLKICQLCVKI